MTFSVSLLVRAIDNNSAMASRKFSHALSIVRCVIQRGKGRRMSDERVCLLRGDSMGQDDRCEERAFYVPESYDEEAPRERGINGRGIIGDV